VKASASGKIALGVVINSGLVHPPRKLVSQGLSDNAKGNKFPGLFAYYHTPTPPCHHAAGTPEGDFEVSSTAISKKFGIFGPAPTPPPQGPVGIVKRIPVFTENQISAMIPKESDTPKTSSPHGNRRPRE
jgi:hypothetical protein